VPQQIPPHDADTSDRDPAELHDAVSQLVIKHADEWTRILEAWWRVSGNNPVFAWMALSLLLHPDRPSAALPDWLRSYLWNTASGLSTAVFALDARRVPELIPQALGLAKKGKSIIDDALTMWNAQWLYGLYEELKQRSPERGRAKWARQKLHEAFPAEFQSEEAVKDRLSEAKRIVQALLVAQGVKPTDEAASTNCAQVMLLRDVLQSLLEAAPTPVLGLSDFRNALPVPPAAAMPSGLR
jgi:hypothetical protein